MPSRSDDPDIILPNNRVARRPRSRRNIILLVLLFVGFLFVHNAVPLYTDWLWFREVGYTNVFTTTIVAKLLLFCVFGVAFFLIFYGNVWLARRLAPDKADRFLMERFGPAWGKTLQSAIGKILLGIAVFLGLWAGRLATEYWANWLEFSHWTPFGLKDPVFGNDVGFYVFRLPMFQYVYEFLIGTLLLTIVSVVVIHVADRAIETFAGLPDIERRVRAQLLALLAALALVQAFGTRLSAYDLLNSENGVFSGAGYADLHYRLLALNVQVTLLILTALACLLSMAGGGGKRADRVRPDSYLALIPASLRWPLIGVGAWLVALFVLGELVPAIGQKAYVEPNQFTMEQEYIRRNIAFTRKGFGLEGVTQVEGFPADNSLTSAGVHANRATLENVRLWDYEYLGKVYSQLQSVKPYYKFERDNADGTVSYNIDIDRYTIGGRLRQVMLAAREMDTGGLPPTAHTWQNRKLGYTHGYGLAMSPVNQIVDGNPTYFISDLPLTVAPEAANLKVTQPDIYYGLLEHDYVFVDTTQSEFDYPSTGGNGTGTQDHYTSYTGRGGIRIGDSEFAKLAFSLQLGDQNVVLAKGFKASTRVLYRRDIRERVQLVAPFVQQDYDPYLVVDPDTGRLVWIIDGYTLSDRYPYSTPQTMAVNPMTDIAPNYIRNSVKATVDAYDGTVTLYLADPNDPIARTYAKIFPGLLKNLSEMPAGLRAHLRYPEDLFRLQRSVYSLYHVDDPRIYYLKEDAWAIPVEPNADQSAGANGGSGPKQMEPYYVIMRLPDVGNATAVVTPKETAAGLNAGGEEFLLMSPLAPINRETQNILGWMCARCDGDHYGQLVLYRFPQSAAVEGPTQIVQRINSDRLISPQLTLLRSGGSVATLGNLLVIPVEKSLLYIAPLYVEATNSPNRLPQLQKVVVSFGPRVAMEDTLEKALADLFPGENAPSTPETTPSGPAPTGPPAKVPPLVRTLIEKAASQYDTAQQRLKAGDFAGYGAATRDLERTLTDLRRAIGSGPTR